MYKLGDMNELRRFILESHLDPRFARAVFESLWMLEAVSINKDFLIREAGSPEEFRATKEIVLHHWNAANMNEQLNQKSAQRVLNLLLLMEIREPGFTELSKLRAIHDLYVHNMLDTKFLNVVNSDSTPEQAAEALKNAVAYQVQQQKTYPDLSEDEERVWNRVRVYHEFPDGFRWVYAVDDDGNIASYIPSEITSKTMNHCGNTPRAKSDDQYWELRDADGKAYLTIILNNKGELEESKSWGNQASKYKKQIQPYVKWFLMDKVKGVGSRYDYGYSTHTNFGVKDFIGDDPEFINYVTEYKPALLGNTEEKILFWKGAVEEGIVTKEQMKRLFLSDLNIGDLTKKSNFKTYRKKSRFEYDRGGAGDNGNIFGDNRFEVLCASCGGCPFSDDELKRHILNKDIDLDEFVNYDIHLLTPKMQHVFVQADPDNFDRILELAEDVASFKVDEALVDELIEPFRHGPSESYNRLLRYLATANPPEKVSKYALDVVNNELVMGNIFAGVRGQTYYVMNIFEYLFDILLRLPEIPILPIVQENYKFLVKASLAPATDIMRRARIARELLEGTLSIGKERGRVLLEAAGSDLISRMATPRSQDTFNDTLTITALAARLMKEHGPAYRCNDFPNKRASLLYMLNLSKEGISVPGIETIGPHVVQGVKRLAHMKSDDCSGDAYSTYMLGLSSNPDLCDELDTGELTMFMCRYENWGYVRSSGECTAELMSRCILDMKRIYAHPSKQLIRRLAEQKIFRLIKGIRGNSPTPEVDEIIQDSLYARAALVGQMGDLRYWEDIRYFVDLVYEGFVHFPVEKWRWWTEIIGDDNFVTWCIAPRNPDALHEDAHAMACIVRYLTGHNIFCSESDLCVPSKQFDVRKKYECFFEWVEYRCTAQLEKVIASEISSLVESGKICITRPVLGELSSRGMIKPKAYRIALESIVGGHLNRNNEIATDDVWKLIRSPMLPSLLCNTLKNKFEKYKNHDFEKGREYSDERVTVHSFRGLVYKMDEKRSYYQIMKAVQLLESSGLLADMDAYGDQLDKRSGMDWDVQIKKYGKVYDPWLSSVLIEGIKALRALAKYYKENPVPEPASKTGKRKMKDGKIA